MSRLHPEPHPMAGKTVRLSSIAADPVRGAIVPGVEFYVQEWVDHMDGEGRTFTEQINDPKSSNWALAHYVARAGVVGLDVSSNEVVYGKIGNLGHCVHVTELGEEVARG